MYKYSESITWSPLDPKIWGGAESGKESDFIITIIKQIHYRYCRIYIYLITQFLNEIVSDCFNFVTTMLSYQVYKYIRHSCLFHICLSHSGGTKILVWGEGEHQTKFHT